MKTFNLGDVISFPSLAEMKLMYMKTEIETRRNVEITRSVYKINGCVNGNPDTIEVTSIEVIHK